GPALPARITASRTAEIRARVAGIVLERAFVEGQDVEQGDLLFQLDPQPLEAALAQARAELARSDAARRHAAAQLARHKNLVATRAVSQQVYENAVNDDRRARAEYARAQANLKTAEINLGYSTIRAPISGRIGPALVTEGALVCQGDATLMARIQVLSPVYADIQQTYAAQTALRGTAPADWRVSVTVPGEITPTVGRLLFAGSAVDPGTGQRMLRAQFDNVDHQLLPGMYVRARVGSAGNAQGILVPQSAVRFGADGLPRVSIVNDAGRVQIRQVTLGDMLGARWHVPTGLQPGERVIVFGAERYAEGASVEPV
ncbi:MAG: efflux RND transporter periplasmic adaptor subunit, partial [Burkholderiaceae bacterium]|nr:efflux RND transporter periplasmic adaptor subunit [Burkholderiaceae bacterium]